MNQQQSAPNLKVFLRTILIIHLVIMGSLIMFSVFLVITSEKMGTFSFTQEPFEFLIPALLIVAVLVGNFLFKTVLNKDIQDKTLKQKLATYQTAHIIRIVPVEGIGLFAIVTYLTTTNLFFLGIAALALLILFTYIPVKEKVEQAIIPTIDEQVYFRNPDKSFSE